MSTKTKSCISPTGSVWTVPNILTISRFLFLFPILWSMSENRQGWLCVFVCLAILSDSLDGYFARRLNQKSDLGKMLDPIVDKVTIIGVILFMLISEQYVFPLWVFLFFLFRELAILFCGFHVVMKHNLVMESRQIGKVSAFVTGLAVFLFALRFQPFGWILLWVALTLTLCSSIDYLRAFFACINKRPQ